MRAGDVLDERQVALVRTVVEEAEARSGLVFSLHVGPSLGDPRGFAERLLGALAERAPHAVLLHVDPTARRVEVLTGSVAALRVDDRACALAALAMGSSFAGGDLVGGVVTGVRMLADHAGPGQVSYGTHRPG